MEPRNNDKQLRNPQTRTYKKKKRTAKRKEIGENKNKTLKSIKKEVDVWPAKLKNEKTASVVSG